MPEDATASTGRFDIGAIANSLPDTATTLLVDKYLTNRAQASARVFGSHRSARSADTLLKSRSRAMLSMPRKKISRKKKMKTSDKRNWIERGCLIVADRHGSEIVAS